MANKEMAPFIKVDCQDPYPMLLPGTVMDEQFESAAVAKTSHSNKVIRQMAKQTQIQCLRAKIN